MGRRKYSTNVELNRNDWVGDWIKSLAWEGYTRADFVNNKDGIRDRVKSAVKQELINKWGEETVNFYFPDGDIFMRPGKG